MWAVLKVTLEGITWVPVFAVGPLQAHWEDKLGSTSGVARHRSWTSLGLWGVGTLSSQGNLPNLLGGLWAGPGVPCSREWQVPRGTPRPPPPSSLSSRPLCVSDFGPTTSPWELRASFFLPARGRPQLSCLCPFKREKEPNQEV